MPKTVLVTGKNGQLGQSLKRLTTHYPLLTFKFVGRDELDLGNSESINDFFSKNQFDVIINCAAYTAVDKAESESELADQINHLAVKQLSEIAKQQNSLLVHVSTDYVFDGQGYRPYVESDDTGPTGIYGATKLDGEKAFLDVNPNGCIIRTSWVYSEFGNNFVKTMLRLGKDRDSLGVIFDQVGSPTYAGDLAQAILQIVSSEQLAVGSETNTNTLSTTHYSPLTKNEIYHFSNEGVCSWYDFAIAIFELSKTQCHVNPIETKDYPTPATRPHYSLMNKAKIKQQFNLTIPYWRDSLRQCLMNNSEF